MTVSGPAAGAASTNAANDRNFEALVEPISAALAAEMVGVSWHPGCPVPLSDLRLITMDYWDFDGQIRRGELVVHHDIAVGVVGVFAKMFAARFPILRMERIEAYDGDDGASMAADNTSAFNCREITGGSGFSVHSWGKAIDINPLENPYIRDGVVLPRAGEAYLDRTDVRPGMIVDGDFVVEAFTAIGFDWGGDWTRLKDYQHFETPDPSAGSVTGDAATPSHDQTCAAAPRSIVAPAVVIADARTGALDLAPLNDFLSTAGPPVSTSPCDAARVLLGLDRPRDEGESVLIVVEPERSGETTVAVTVDHLADDSVAAVRHVLRFARQADGSIRLASGLWSHRCQPGRGHQDFSTERCV
jgi:hypothetical protein